MFSTALTNAEGVFGAFSKAPFAALQQVIVNWAGYIEDLVKDPSSISTVIKDIEGNAHSAFNGATFLGGDQVSFINPLSNGTIDVAHAPIYLALTGQAVGLGIPAPPAPIPTIVDFLSSPLSGVLIGVLGPEISPWVALANDLSGISTALFGATPDFTTALQDLVNIPADMVGGFLNGATLDLSSLIPAIEHLGLIPLPPGASLDGLSITFGGLLSAGATSGLDSVGTGIGGSIFNSLGIDLSNVPILEPWTLQARSLARYQRW